MLDFIVDLPQQVVLLSEIQYPRISLTPILDSRDPAFQEICGRGLGMKMIWNTKLNKPGFTSLPQKSLI